MNGYYTRFSDGVVTYYPKSEIDQDYDLAMVTIFDTDYPITYGIDSSSDQILVQTVVLKNIPVGLHVIAPFEMPTGNKANVIELIKAIGKAAIAINDKCKEQEIGFLQLLEEHL